MSSYLELIRSFGSYFENGVSDQDTIYFYDSSTQRFEYAKLYYTIWYVGDEKYNKSYIWWGSNLWVKLLDIIIV